MNLLPNAEFATVSGPVGAGTSSQNGTVIDMAGFDGVVFVYKLGALTTNQVTKLIAKQDTTSGGSFTATLTGADTGAAADGDSNKLLVLDVFRPTKQFVRPTLVRGTANAVIEAGIAIKYRGSKGPVVQGATVSKSATVASPPEA